MLNGCASASTHQQYGRDGTTVIKETLTVGYLDQEQLSLIYRLICAMRKVPAAEYERGLSSDALRSLMQCDIHHKYLYDYHLIHQTNINEEIKKDLYNIIRQNQLILSSIDNNLLYLQAGCIGVTEEFLDNAHKRLREILIEIQKSAGDNEYDQCLKFLNSLQLKQKVLNLLPEVNNYSNTAMYYRINTSKLVSSMQRIGSPFQQPNPEILNLVTCRICGNKLKTNKDENRNTVKCPSCQYHFAVDSSVPVGKKHGINQNNSIFSRLFKFLGKK